MPAVVTNPGNLPVNELRRNQSAHSDVRNLNFSSDEEREAKRSSLPIVKPAAIPLPQVKPVEVSRQPEVSENAVTRPVVAEKAGTSAEEGKIAQRPLRELADNSGKSSEKPVQKETREAPLGTPQLRMRADCFTAAGPRSANLQVNASPMSNTGPMVPLNNPVDIHGNASISKSDIVVAAPVGPSQELNKVSVHRPEVVKISVRVPPASGVPVGVCEPTTPHPNGVSPHRPNASAYTSNQTAVAAPPSEPILPRVESGRQQPVGNAGGKVAVIKAAPRVDVPLHPSYSGRTTGLNSTVESDDRLMPKASVHLLENRRRLAEYREKRYTQRPGTTATKGLRVSSHFV
jgi:hypothetical protein